LGVKIIRIIFEKNETLSFISVFERLGDGITGASILAA